MPESYIGDNANEFWSPPNLPVVWLLNPSHEASVGLGSGPINFLSRRAVA